MTEDTRRKTIIKLEDLRTSLKHSLVSPQSLHSHLLSLLEILVHSLKGDETAGGKSSSASGKPSSTPK